MHVHLINPLYELREIQEINIYNFCFYLKVYRVTIRVYFLLVIKWRWHYLDFILSNGKMTSG
jgi:hypothetical protein